MKTLREILYIAIILAPIVFAICWAANHALSR